MIYLITFLVSLVLDQITKFYVVENFKMYQSMPIWGDFLALTFTTNTGGAFGIFSRYPMIFMILSIIMLTAGIILAAKIVRLSSSYQVSFGLIVGGTAGNLADRIYYGWVIDFIDFSFWPTFNIADVAICVGVGLLIINLFTASEGKSILKEDSGSSVN